MCQTIDSASKSSNRHSKCGRGSRWIFNWLRQANQRGAPHTLESFVTTETTCTYWSIHLLRYSILPFLLLLWIHRGQCNLAFWKIKTPLMLKWNGFPHSNVNLTKNIKDKIRDCINTQPLKSDWLNSTEVQPICPSSLTISKMGIIWVQWMCPIWL